LGWVYPIGRALHHAGFCTLQEVVQAMVNALTTGYPQPILEVNTTPISSASPTEELKNK